jgi:hypothetical protein
MGFSVDYGCGLLSFNRLPNSTRFQGAAADVTRVGAGVEILLVGDLTSVVFQYESRQRLGVIIAG